MIDRDSQYFMPPSLAALFNFFCVIALFHLFLPHGLRAQINPGNAAQVKHYYDAVAFDKAISLGRELLHSAEKLSPEELAVIHQYLALSFYNIGKLDSSRTHFLSLLSIYPDMELDPVTISPKIIDFFNSLKKEFQTLNNRNDLPTFTRYIFVDDPRPAAGWRSALLPGWGQFYKHQKMRGIVLGGAFWSSLIATGFAALRESQTHQDYLDSRNPAEINQNYDTYNNWYKTRRALTVTTAVLWGITVADALWSSYPKPTVTLIRAGTPGFGLTVRF